MSGQWDDLLPTRVEVGGREYAIRSDYRAVLDICAALADPELTDEERALCALHIFYPDLDDIPVEQYEEALKQCFRFIDCGDDGARQPSPRLVDWEQDFRYIVAPINRVCGQEIRSLEYMHWWTFIGAYMEIGDCTFAQIVNIRSKLACGKPLDKAERQWYRQNQHLVDFKNKYTHNDQERFTHWGA